MPQAAFSPRISPKAALTHLTIGMLFAVLPASAAQGRLFSSNDYRVCVNELIGDGLELDVSTSACARALHPEELSECVEDLASATSIGSLDALKSCARVRRPDDLSDCTISINSDLDGVIALDALDHCRRSLLPERYAECVLGFESEVVEFSAMQILDACIDAGYKPTDLAPTFIPLESGQDSSSL